MTTLSMTEIYILLEEDINNISDDRFIEYCEEKKHLKSWSSLHDQGTSKCSFKGENIKNILTKFSK